MNDFNRIKRSPTPSIGAGGFVNDALPRLKQEDMAH